MIVDVTGTILVPGNGGRNCPGNGEDDPMNCCCDECDYMMCCFEMEDDHLCLVCEDRYCPRSPNHS